MYFVRTRQAIEDLQNNRINDKETVKYLFGLGIISGLGLPLFIGIESENNSLIDICLFIIGMVALFVILRKCFKINCQSDGKHFFNRFLVLDFIISLRLLLFFFVISLCGSVIFILITRFEMITEGPAKSMLKYLVIKEFIVEPILELIIIFIWFAQLLVAFRRLTKTHN